MHTQHDSMRTAPTVGLSAWQMFRQAAIDWFNDGAMMHGAALAFYSVLSIAPLLVITVAMAGFVFGEEAASGELVAQIHSLVGPEGAEAIQEMLAHREKQKTGLLATLLGVAMLLIGASGVFAQLQVSLNAIWNVRPKPGGYREFVSARISSFAMVLGTGFLLLVSLVLSAMLTAAGTWLVSMISGWDWLLQIGNFLVSFGVITLLFAMIYKVLPDVKIEWADVWLGAAMTALLFSVGKFAIGVYLGYAGVGSIYGAAGSLVVLVLWIYYSSQILFFGAEFTQVYARRNGRPIEPADNAEHMER